MKIEQLLVQHFYNHREVTLQGMGTFTLSPDFVMPKENDKDAEIPDNAIAFQYNSRATADDALIVFIVQQTRKMKSLAAADLDSYLVLGKQFLNIGKPFIIEGIGMLVKSQQGDLEFKKGTTFPAKLETAPAALREKAAEENISFTSGNKKSPTGGRKALLLAVIIVGIGLAVTAVWYFLPNDKKTTVAPPLAVKDTIKKAPVITDSAVAPAKPVVTEAPDPYTFKVVFMVTADSAAAVDRMNKLIARKHNVIMYKQDSLYYRLAEPYTNPLADTTHIKDSLNSFYYVGKAFIELK